MQLTTVRIKKPDATNFILSRARYCLSSQRETDSFLRKLDASLAGRAR